MRPQEIPIKNYNYELPNEKIALFPLESKHEAKLMVVKNGEISDDQVINIASYLPQNSLIIFNDSKVIPARIPITIDSGGILEIFLLEPIQPNNYDRVFLQKGEVKQLWKCLIGGAKKWKQALQQITLNNGVVLNLELQQRIEDAYQVEISWHAAMTFGEILEAIGKIPLPPYIKREVDKSDAYTYQTLFANKEGSVAAPTAGLHYTPEVFETLEQKNISKTFVSLHVGAGTFKPVKSETIGDHTMHSEYFEVSRTSLQSIIDANFITIVGTTSLRTIETLYWLGCKLYQQQQLSYPFEFGQWDAYDTIINNCTRVEAFRSLLQYAEINSLNKIECRTSIIITPLYKIKVADALATNFHQPQSTLLLLVASILGDQWEEVYDYALKNEYRFLSYGDTSLLMV